jgi:hypothetical protein
MRINFVLPLFLLGIAGLAFSQTYARLLAPRQSPLLEEQTLAADQNRVRVFPEINDEIIFYSNLMA